jgi:hypothetical protein
MMNPKRQPDPKGSLSQSPALAKPQNTESLFDPLREGMLRVCLLTSFVHALSWPLAGTGRMQGSPGCTCKDCLRLWQRDMKDCGRANMKDILCDEYRGNVLYIVDKEPNNANYDLCVELKTADVAYTNIKIYKTKSKGPSGKACLYPAP